MKSNHTPTSHKTSMRGFWKLINEAKKDPRFMREIKAFIKASTSVYKLE